MVSVIVSIVAFLLVLAVVVLAHELGHFATAKAFNVKVEEFGLGFPPRLLSVKRGETEYSLNLVPLGGFTKLAGEEDPNVARSLASKSKGIRLLVLGAGSLMNLIILPILLFSVAFMVPHNVVAAPVVVAQVAPNSPAAVAGIKPGDTILSINGEPISTFDDLTRYVQANLDKEVTIVVQHSDSTTESVRLTPRSQPPAGQGAIGISAATVSQHYPFWQAIPMGVTQSIATLVLLKDGIVSMIAGTVPVAVVGPVGIAQITGEVAQAGIVPLLGLAAVISLNLGIINIFPIPGLDGGRIVFVLLEWVRRGRRVSPKTEGLVHLIGFAALMTFVLFITYFDIMRIATGQGFTP